MRRSRSVSVSWQHKGEDFIVTGRYTPGTPDRGPDFGCAGGYPGDPAEFELDSVAEDALGGALRPDLLAAAEADFSNIGDRAEEAAAEDDGYDGPDTMEEARGER